MDERIDILNSSGEFIGKTALKSDAHKNGWFHSTIHVWFYNSDGKILLQQRGKDKEVHPLLWDVSVAGHVGAGEDIKMSAIREVEEEIGLKVLSESLTKIGVFKSVQKHREDLVDCEFHHTFLCELRATFEQLTKQKSEVEDLKLIYLHQFVEEIWDISKFKNYVPHDSLYYDSVIEEIKKRLKYL